MFTAVALPVSFFPFRPSLNESLFSVKPEPNVQLGFDYSNFYI